MPLFRRACGRLTCFCEPNFISLLTGYMSCTGWGNGGGGNDNNNYWKVGTPWPVKEFKQPSPKPVGLNMWSAQDARATPFFCLITCLLCSSPSQDCMAPLTLP